MHAYMPAKDDGSLNDEILAKIIKNSYGAASPESLQNTGGTLGQIMQNIIVKQAVNLLAHRIALNNEFATLTNAGASEEEEQGEEQEDDIESEESIQEEEIMEMVLPKMGKKVSMQVKEEVIGLSPSPTPETNEAEGPQLEMEKKEEIM